LFVAIIQKLYPIVVMNYRFFERGRAGDNVILKKGEKRNTMKHIVTTSKMLLAAFLLLTLVIGANSDAQAQFTPVDLSTWTAESYPAVSGFDPGEWTVSDDGLSVNQSVNGQPTLFYSDFDVFNTEVEGSIQVAVGQWDDDFIGFALGFKPGDTVNSNANYLLVDWKKQTQWFNFGAPSCTPGSWAPAGLAVSRVFGIPTADEFWGHVDFPAGVDCPDTGGLEQLARGTTLGSTGWVDGQEYVFRFEYSATSLKVYVNDNLEIDIAGSFNNGRLAFYNFSQEDVTYSSYVVVVVNVGIDIKPGSDPNCFNNDGHGVIPIAILGSETFDVSLIDPYSVSLEGMAVRVVGKADKALAHIEDVNEDGFDDLVVQIEDQDGIFEPGIGVATVTGLLVDGRNFEGSDFICVTQ
jgi:hypothetical protein